MLKYPVSKPELTDIEREALLGAFDSGRITQGPRVITFERAFAKYVGAEYAVATTNGTSALHLALAAYSIGPGDEVIVPNLTFVATANAVAYTGATPVFVDVSPTTGCLDIELTANAITDRTRAIVPVHLYGLAADVRALKVFNLILIEDAAEGLGGFVGDSHLGTLGHAGTYSFYGNKVMTTGEGGMIVTNHRHVAYRMEFLRNQGMYPSRRYLHVPGAFNYRMTDLAASIGMAQLYRLPGMLERRQEICDRYAKNLCYHVHVFPNQVNVRRAPWLFTCLLPDGIDRDETMARLEDVGIETRPTFVPMNVLFKQPGSFPASHRIADRGISLPTYPQLTDWDVDHISELVVESLV